MKIQRQGTQPGSLWARRAAAALTILLSLGVAGPRGSARADGGGNPSPVAGSRASQDANQRADAAMGQAVEYVNAAKPGPRIIVLPGEIKSNNATFTQHVTANNIADFAELELSRANFNVIERSSLGALQREVELAYDMGDPAQAMRVFQKGKLRTTKWIVKFDVLKVEQVASAKSGFNGGVAASLLNLLGGGSTAAAVGSVTAGSVQTSETAGVWVVGMRYKVIDANTTEQVASGYAEDKMELGQKSTSVLGVSTGASGQLTLDSLTQRLVQRCVAEIDARYK